jgi:hypothetical protein
MVYFFDSNVSMTSPVASAATNSSATVSINSYKPAYAGTHVIEATFSGDPANNLAPSDKQVPLPVTGDCATNGNASICIITSSGTTPSILYQHSPWSPPYNH